MVKQVLATDKTSMISIEGEADRTKLALFEWESSQCSLAEMVEKDGAS
jgi:hypothetical protein